MDAPSPFKELIVLPGDDVTPSLVSLDGSACPSVRLGSGLLQTPSGCVQSTLAGVLCHLPPNRYFVLSSHRRYTPAVGDTVVGVVRDRAGEGYRVRVHGTSLAHLPQLAFDGATRRNKPSLAAGALVFCRVAACSPHMEPELTCCAPPGAGKKDWVTGQGLFGELAGGRLVHVSLGLARRLLDPSCALLATLAKRFPFEVAVGVNGLVWVTAEAPAQVNALAAAIEASEGAGEKECVELANRCAQAAAAPKGAAHTSTVE
jgi:exosome complex component RRP40